MPRPISTRTTRRPRCCRYRARWTSPLSSPRCRRPIRWLVGAWASRSATTAALNGPEDCIKEMGDTYRKRRDPLVESFGRPGWEIPPPEASMFAWVPLPEAFRSVGSMQFATLMVEKSGVAVSPGVGFGEHGEGYVRIAMVENEQRIRQAARGLRRFLESGIETLHNVVPLANRR